MLLIFTSCYSFIFQSPHKYAMVVFTASVILKLPRFFHFRLNDAGDDYITTDLMEDTAYVLVNAYWDDLMITGFIPLFVLVYFNTRMYLRVSTHPFPIRVFSNS